METIVLKAKKREVTGREARKQAENNVPAVMYGNAIESGSIWVDATEFKRLFDKAGTNTVVSLDVDGKKVNVLVYDYQLDAISDEFTHIDFYAVNMKEAVEAEVPLVFVGVSAAVKELGGTLIKNNDSLVVKALPAELPHEIEVDLSGLATFDDSISVGDVSVSDKVEIILDENATIASVIAPRTEEEMAELDSEVDADVSKIEGMADKDEEGEDGEEGEEKKEEEKTEKK
ncbi:MAG: 50S ribosomal protein L25 [Candidatus Moraniibacteriota bacterium]|jgi:large subunit ribosomal protein L25